MIKYVNGKVFSVKAYRPDILTAMIKVSALYKHLVNCPLLLENGGAWTVGNQKTIRQSKKKKN